VVEKETKAIAELKQGAELEIKEAKEKAQKEAERITREAMGGRGKKGDEESARVIAEARQKAEQISQEADERAKKELKGREAVAKPAVEEEAAVVAPAAEVEAGAAPEEAGGAELYLGRVELEIIAPIDFGQMMKLQAQLRGVTNLRLVSAGGSAAGNTTVVVSIDKPLPLINILRKMPPVKGVVKKEKNIQVALEASQGT
jgi:hypothetical protein